jgi:hypothetical protein
MIYPFYIDKRLNSQTKNYIDIKLPYPIIAEQHEELYIQINNIQYVNNLYNVSQYLQNNIISLIKTYYIYDQVNVTSSAGNETNIDLLNEFYDMTLQSVDKLKDTTTQTFDDNTKIFMMENSNYKLHYKADNDWNVILQGTDPFYTGASYNNIFSNDANAKLQFNEYQNYIIIENKNNYIDLLKKVSFAIDYDGSVSLTYNVAIDLIIDGSNDGVNYVNIGTLIPNMSRIEFDIGTGAINKSKIDIYYNTLNPYKYYKIYFSTNIVEAQTTLQNAFTLNYLDLNSAEYELNATSQSPINFNIKIPDGYYRVSNYITTLNNLLEEHNITLTYNNITNKIEILNNNNHTPYYNSVDENGVVYMFLGTKNLQINFGSNTSSFLLPRSQTYILDNGINLINSQKIILTTNLELENSSHNEIIGGNDLATGIGNIITWINNDIPPLSCVNYDNIQNIKYKLNDKIISNIIFYIYNEKSQQINLDNFLISFHIVKE